MYSQTTRRPWRGQTEGCHIADPGAPEDALLLALEGQGRILRGRFSSNELEWCDRRLLARIHRYTLNKLRAAIEPVTAPVGWDGLTVTVAAPAWTS